jgi:hypothetical protein
MLIDSPTVVRQLEEASKQPGVVARNEGDAGKASPALRNDSMLSTRYRFSLMQQWSP